jgi:hypothetical protein
MDNKMLETLSTATSFEQILERLQVTLPRVSTACSEKDQQAISKIVLQVDTLLAEIHRFPVHAVISKMTQLVGQYPTSTRFLTLYLAMQMVSHPKQTSPSSPSAPPSAKSHAKVSEPLDDEFEVV